MLPLRALPLALLTAALVAGCGGSGKTSVPKDAAAVVGSQIVPKWRVDDLLAQAKVAYANSDKTFPSEGTPSYDALKQRATGFLVVGAMYLDRARRDGIVVSDQDVDASLTKIRNTTYGGSAAKQAAAWKKQGITRNEAREEERLHLTEQRVERKLLNHIKITSADLQGYYDENKARFSVPESRAIRMIFVRSLPLASQIEGKLKNGADFEKLVAQYSQDAQTKAKKGALVVAKGQGSKAFQNAVFGLSVGQISSPIQEPDGGIRIITPLGAAQPPRYTPFKEIKDILKMQLVDEKRQSVVQNWQVEVKNEYCGSKITYASGYAAEGDADPCGQNRSVPAGSG